MSLAMRIADKSGMVPTFKSSCRSGANDARRHTADRSEHNLTIDIVNDFGTFQNLRSEWNALHQSNHTNQLAFQSYSWIHSWMASYAADPGKPSEVAIVTARTGGRLRLVCPFAIKQVLGLTCLSWLGEPASQYGDIVTDGTKASSALIESVLAFTIDRLQPDIVHLRKVRDDAAIRPWLEAQTATATAPDEAPYLDFRNTTSFDDYCAKYSAKARKNRRRLRRRLEEIDVVSTSVLQPGETARRAIRTGIAFKQAWLVERGHVSSGLRDAHMPDFLDDFVRRTDRHARPFVSIMHCGETPVSVQFGVIANRRLALHMIAYNPAMEKTGAGVLHIEDTIAYSIENGLSELDFLAPDAPYKRDWADAAMPVSDYVAAHTIQGRLFAQGYLCSARDLLKTRVAALPLGIRQTIAKHIQVQP